MLAAINTDELSYFNIDEWLENIEHSYYALRTNDMLDNDDVFNCYYLAFASNEKKLVDLITCDIWKSCDTYNDPDILTDNPFPFYIVNVETKKVLKKIELTIQKRITIKEVGR